MNCVNKLHPEFIKLQKELKVNKNVLAAKIATYQDRNNTDKFPTADYIRGSLKLVKIVESHVAISDFKQAFGNINNATNNDIYKFLNKYQVLSKDGEQIKVTKTGSNDPKYQKYYNSKKINRNKDIVTFLKANNIATFKEYTKTITDPDTGESKTRISYTSVDIINPNGLYEKTTSDMFNEMVSKEEVATPNDNIIIEKDGQTALFQKSNKKKQAINDKQAKQLDNKIKTWLSAMGIDIKFVDTITDNNGNPINAVAKADIIKRIIEVVQGDADVTTLPEEAAHFLVEMLGMEHPLVQKMMNEIQDNPIYQKVVAEYGDTYNNDEERLKKEAVGKLIAKHLTGIDNDITKGSKGWFKSIVKWFKQLFYGFDTNVIENELSSFREAADMILNMDTDFINRIEDSAVNEMYQLSNKGDGTVQDDLITDMETKSDTIAEIKYKDRYMTKSGKIIKGRVSDLVSKVARGIFGGENNFKDGPNYNALKGTVLHMYNEVIVNAIVSDKELSYQDALNKVHAILKDGGDFTKNKNIEFFEIGVINYNNLKQGMNDLIAQEKAKDPGMKILTEQILVDDSVDIAGTVDLTFVYSDGSVSIYDYKTKMYKGKNIPEISSANKVLYSTQLSEYKRILASKYGVTKFRQSRIIPIYFKPKYNGREIDDNGIGKLDIWSASSTNDKLIQLPVAKELTDDEGVNSFLIKLMDREETISKSLKKKYTPEKNAELKHIQEMIERLQRNKDINFVLVDLKNTIIKTKEKIKNNNLDNSEAKNALDYLSLYKDLATNFVSVVRDGLAEAKMSEDEQVMKDFRTFEESFNRLFTSTSITINSLTQYIVDINNEASDSDLTKGSAPKGIMGRLFHGLAKWDNPAFQRLRVLISQATGLIKQDVESVHKEVEEKDKALTQWAKSKGLRGINKFKNIINKDTGNLITKINKTFFTDREKAKKINNIEWAEDNLKFNNDKFEKYLKKVRDNMEDDVISHTEKSINNNLKRLREKFNPAVNPSNWYKNNNSFVSVKEGINEKYISNEWKYMNESGNEPLLDYYNMYVKYNMIFEELTDNQGKFKSNFIANIRKDTIDKMAETGILSALNLKESLVSSLEVREYDDMMGSTEDSEQVNKIPLLYTDGLKGNISPKEERDIKEEVKKEGLEEGYPEYDARVNYLKAKKEKENGMINKSYNLSSSLLLMADSAYRYRHMSDIEAAVLNVREILVNKQTEEITDRFGDKIKDKVTRVVSKALNVSSQTIDSYDSFMKLLVYGQYVQNKDIKMKVGNREISLNKFISGLLKYQSFKSIGLNPVLAFANLAGTQANYYITASEGRYYNKTNARKAIKNITSRDKKSLAAIGIIEPTAMNITQLMSEKLSATNTQKYVNNTNVFFMMKAGDDLIDNQILLAMMDTYVVDDDGIIKNTKSLGAKNPLKNKEAKPLSEYLVQDKKGNWGFEGVSLNELNNFRMKVQHVANLIKGSTGVEQDMLINTTMLGNILMKFKSWMPGLSEARFSKLQYMENIDDFEQGRFSVALGDMMHHGVLKSTTELSKLMLEAVSFGLYQKEVNRERAKFYMDKYNENNPDKQITSLDAYIDFRRAKIKATATEVRMYLAFLSMFMLMGATGWDDDKEGSFYSKYSYKLTRRAYLELSFFFDPTSFTSIVKSPVSVIRVIEDWTKLGANTIDVLSEDLGITEKTTGDKTGRFHYMLKEFPPTNLVQDWYSIVNDLDKAQEND